MFVNRRAPHGTLYALEALDAVLVAGALDQKVSLVFMDDGVYQLVRDQKTEGVGLKNFARAYRALGDYDVRDVYVELESMQARGLRIDDLVIPASLITAKSLGALMAQQDVVLSF